MSDRDLDAFLDSLAEAEREGQEKGLGEGLPSAIDGADQRREEQTRSLLDAIARARLEQEGEQE